VLPGHIVEEYLKSYREYIMREAEKSRKLKILDQIKTGNPEDTNEVSARFAPVSLWHKISHRVSLWQARYRRPIQRPRLVDALLSLFQPEPPCEAC
jgi:hypothetical protein